MENIDWKTAVDLPLIHEGKVRLTFELPNNPDLLLVVATDRVSTHNIVHNSLVPGKGEVLTALTLYWTRSVLTGFSTHIQDWGVRIYDHFGGSGEVEELGLHRRALVVKKLRMIPVEFIFRQYLTGSLWKVYKSGGPNPYGLNLPDGLPKMYKFVRTIFTPTDKSETDDPMDFAQVERDHRHAVTGTYQLFLAVQRHLNSKGIELIDSKFEVGVDAAGALCIGDEITTPDSSRFCELSEISEGEDPHWLDKQILRDEAERIWGDGPKIPLEFDPFLISSTKGIYEGIFERIAGGSLTDYQNFMMNS